MNESVVAGFLATGPRKERAHSQQLLPMAGEPADPAITVV
jgi:hypothetical protein